jgi:hypothetical protein
VRAYLESYQLVQLTGNLNRAYPGFLDAVPPDESADLSSNKAAWDRRPSEGVAAKGPLAGNLKYHILSSDLAATTASATVCSYTYGLSEDNGGGQYTQFPTGGSAESRGIFGIKLTLTAPRNPAASNLPPQIGAERAPSDNVFGGWQIIGYQTSASSTERDWPEHEEVQRQCAAKAPDSVERRKYLLKGPHSADVFEELPPVPGWPTASLNKA